MYQDGVRVLVCIGYCDADFTRRDPTIELDVCPMGHDFCDPDCPYYKEDL